MPFMMSRTLLLSGLISSASLSSLAQTPSPDLALGYMGFKLNPASGSPQNMNGPMFQGSYGFLPSWSIVGEISHVTGTESGTTDLVHNAGLVGARFGYPTGSFTWFGQVLIGKAQLKATYKTFSDSKSSTAFAPGVGVDYAFARNFALRLQADFLLTQYAEKHQNNTRLGLSAVWRIR